MIFGSYSKKLIIDYINGNGVDGYSLEELEDDVLFMLSVFSETKDINIYNLCSNRLRNDYYFVKCLIKLFYNNIDFISKVADYYLKNCTDELLRFELLIIMSDLTISNKEINRKYTLIRDSIFIFKKVEIELSKRSIEEADYFDKIQMGFIMIFNCYYGSEIILNFFAKKYIDEILTDNYNELETLIHTQFKSFEQFLEFGLNKYLLNYIASYDSMLAGYLQVHIGLMTRADDTIDKIKKDWYKYDKRREQEKYYMVLDRVQEYMKNVQGNYVLSEENLLYYIGRNLGIADIIAKYDYISSDMYDTLLELAHKIDLIMKY